MAIGFIFKAIAGTGTGNSPGAALAPNPDVDFPRTRPHQPQRAFVKLRIGFRSLRHIGDRRMCGRDPGHWRRSEIHLIHTGREHPHFNARDAGNHIGRPDRHQQRIRPCFALKENVRAAHMSGRRGGEGRGQQQRLNAAHASASRPRPFPATSKRRSNRARSAFRCGTPTPAPVARNGRSAHMPCGLWL